VQASWLLRGHFETTVALGTLKRDFRRTTVRYRLNYYAGWVLAMAALGLAIAAYQARGRMPSVLGILCGTVGVAAGAVMLLTHRNRRMVFVRFDALVGRGGLDIGLAGSDASTFEAFVARVQGQIARCSRAGGEPTARA
jgi:hypothetical protein